MTGIDPDDRIPGDRGRVARASPRAASSPRDRPTSTCRRMFHIGSFGGHQADGPAVPRGGDPGLLVLLGRLAAPGHGPRAGCSSPASPPTAWSATPWPATSSAATTSCSFVPYLVRALLLHPASTTSSLDPAVHPVPDLLARRHGLRPGRDELGRLQRTSASASTASSATSSSRPCPRRQPLHVPAAGPAGVLLQHPGPPGHAGAASVRQHARRSPAARSCSPPAGSTCSSTPRR